MTNFIHPQAVVDKACQVGFFSVIGQGVIVGRGSCIGNNVTVYPGTVIGENCSIGDNCVIGKHPHPAVTSRCPVTQDLQSLKMSPGSVLGSGVVLYAGTVLGMQVMVGDLASVRENCIIGYRVIIGRGAVLENDVVVGEYAKVQTGAYLTAYTVVGARAFIAPMVVTANDNRVGRRKDGVGRLNGPCIEENARVGAGALLLPGVTVTRESFVAAGSLVTRDTRPESMVMGRPARFVRPVPDAEKL